MAANAGETRLWEVKVMMMNGRQCFVETRWIGGSRDLPKKSCRIRNSSKFNASFLPCELQLGVFSSSSGKEPTSTIDLLLSSSWNFPIGS